MPCVQRENTGHFTLGVLVTPITEVLDSLGNTNSVVVFIYMCSPWRVLPPAEE